MSKEFLLLHFIPLDFSRQSLTAKVAGLPG